MQFRRYLTIFGVMAALVSWHTIHAEDSTKGDEMNGQSKTYNLSGFTGVYATAAVDIEITQGDAFSVLAYTESGDFSGLELRIEDGVLIATRPEEIWKGENTSSWRRFFSIGSNDKNISIKRVNGQRVIKINGERVPTYTVRVAAPKIDRLGASSSSIVTAQGIKTRDLAIKASSSGDINAEVVGGDVSVDATSSGDVVLSGTYDNLDIKATSSADVVVSGTCEKLDIKASSSADVKAGELTSQQLSLRSTSSSNINAEVVGGDVSVDATSSGDVVLSGTCDNLDIKATSGANVKASDLTCQNGNLRASSGADITTMLTETVNAHASSGGDILVRGGAKPVKVKESSGGDVSIRN